MPRNMSKTKALQEVINPFMSKIYNQGTQDLVGARDQQKNQSFPTRADASSTAASVEEIN